MFAWALLAMEILMKRYFVIAACLWFAAGAAYSATKEQKRLENCGVVMQEVLNIPDNLPHDVLEKAECVVVFPSLLKVAFGMGKDYGREPWFAAKASSVDLGVHRQCLCPRGR